jgi:hypothetical protein
VRKKREHYLAFLKYPEYMRQSFSTTNVVEAVNGQLEIMRRNGGGYFHSGYLEVETRMGCLLSRERPLANRRPNYRHGSRSTQCHVSISL